METIQKDWQLALDILQPTKKELEHGLELHRNSYVFDAYGFAPTGGGKFPRLDELIRQHASRDELTYALEEFRKVQSFREPAMRKRLAEFWEKAGVDCNLIIGDRMIHCYPICPIPEAEPVQKEIWAAIVRTEND